MNLNYSQKPQLNIGAVISRYVTIIKVKRNHSTESGFFIVNVPEVKQYGFGFTIYIKGMVYGFSVHNNVV
jgi:hypothetical protein